jgi:NhaP-type Na+/H+ and K+/H+ antiporter
MTTLNIELLDALKKAGVHEETARRAAAKSVLSVDQLDQLITKADLKAELAELKVDLIKWMAGLIIGAVVAMTGIFAGIVKLIVP